MILCNLRLTIHFSGFLSLWKFRVDSNIVTEGGLGLIKNVNLFKKLWNENKNWKIQMQIWTKAGELETFCLMTFANFRSFQPLNEFLLLFLLCSTVECPLMQFKVGLYLGKFQLIFQCKVAHMKKTKGRDQKWKCIMAVIFFIEIFLLLWTYHYATRIKGFDDQWNAIKV